MKGVKLLVLSGSHLLFVLWGWWLGGGWSSPGDTQPPEEPAGRKVPVVEASAASPPNPILRASGVDFRAAWSVILLRQRDANGALQWNSSNFFIDWCGVDPEGAVLGLSEFYGPRVVHDYLSRAVRAHGPQLAPALVKHWRKLRLLQEYKLEHFMGRALNKLAREDPAGAADLTADLPPGKRCEVYRTLFQNLKLESLEPLAALGPQGAHPEEWERLMFWEHWAEAVDRADPGAGVWRGMEMIKEPTARRMLVIQGVDKAVRTEGWAEFFDGVSRLEAPAREDVRTAALEGLQSVHEDLVMAFVKECELRGWEDWAEAARTGPAPR